MTRVTRFTPVSVAERWRYRWRRVQPWSFLFPYLCLVSVFVLAPLGMVVAYSFTDFTGLGDAQWVGWDNYLDAINYRGFARIMINHVLLLLGMILWVIVPLVMAVVLHELPASSIIRVVLFIPVPLSPVIIGRVFQLVFDSDGPFNAGLRALGLEHLLLNWLVNDQSVLVIVVLVVTWGITGAGVLFYTAALSTLPKDQLEAARVDGANWFQTFRFVYEPNLRPVTRFWTLIMTIITLVNLFPWIFGLTTGGSNMGAIPIGSTTFDYLIYLRGVRTGQFGESFAIANVALIYLLVVLGLQYSLFRWRSPDA